MQGSKSINIYFKYILPVFILVLLGREVAVLRVTPSEHYIENINFFVPDFIEIDAQKSEFAALISPYIANKKLVHLRYKDCAITLVRYSVFNKVLAAKQTTNCLKILDEALMVVPGSPLIWLEKAKLYSQQNELSLLNRALINAALAKGQSWVVRRRIDFSLQNWNQLSDMNKSNIENDFLYSSSNDISVVKTLAAQYLLNPESENIVEDWIKKSELDVQKYFVNYVRAGR